LARITVIRPDGIAHEMHVRDPYAYASELAHRHRREAQGFTYQVEVSGESVSGPFSTDQIILRALLKKEFDV